MTSWPQVRERVLALRSAVNGRRVFGANSHRFELDAPLSTSELDDIEAWLGTRLPADYRGFLGTVGAGGAGPAYGVFPLRRSDEGWHWLGDGAEMTDPSLMSTPFPEPVPPAVLAALHARRPDEDDFASLVDFDPAYEAWIAEIDAVLSAPQRTAGALCLCHEGCAQRVWLIVTGDQRGTMWRDLRCDDQDLEPMRAADGSPLTFADWYCDWLDRAERTALD